VRKTGFEVCHTTSVLPTPSSAAEPAARRPAKCERAHERSPSRIRYERVDPFGFPTIERAMTMR
jgi:hypothetical protein